jgi:hypothetical protein
MAVRVHHSRHDREPRAVDDVVAVDAILDCRDAPAGDADVGAAEIARADVDETASEDELRYAPASVATSATAVDGISSSRT